MDLRGRQNTIPLELMHESSHPRYAGTEHVARTQPWHRFQVAALAGDGHDPASQALHRMVRENLATFYAAIEQGWESGLPELVGQPPDEPKSRAAWQSNDSSDLHSVVAPSFAKPPLIASDGEQRRQADSNRRDGGRVVPGPTRDDDGDLSAGRLIHGYAVAGGTRNRLCFGKPGRYPCYQRIVIGTDLGTRITDEADCHRQSNTVRTVSENREKNRSYPCFTDHAAISRADSHLSQVAPNLCACAC